MAIALGRRSSIDFDPARPAFHTGPARSARCGRSCQTRAQRDKLEYSVNIFQPRIEQQNVHILFVSWCVCVCVRASLEQTNIFIRWLLYIIYNVHGTLVNTICANKNANLTCSATHDERSDDHRTPPRSLRNVLHVVCPFPTGAISIMRVYYADRARSRARAITGPFRQRKSDRDRATARSPERSVALSGV